MTHQHRQNIILLGNIEKCRPCREAHKYLDDHDADYEYIEVSMTTLKPVKKQDEEFIEYLKKSDPAAKNYKYIPMIWIDGKFIGGFSDLVDYCEFDLDDDF